MTDRRHALSLTGLIALALCICGRSAFAAENPSREALNQAVVAAHSIDLGGDQSAAIRYIACTLSRVDPRAALDMIDGIRRPSDAARAAASVVAALAKTDPARAKQAAASASKMLLRIVEPARRDQEQELLLREIALLGNDAVVAVSEVPAQTARAAVADSLAASNPAAALALLKSWQMYGAAVDRTVGEIAVNLASSDPDQAMKIATGIVSDPWRARALWQIAELRPPAEAAGIAQQVADPLIKSAVLTSAAVRLAIEDPESAISLGEQVTVAGATAEAQVAAALAPSDADRALALARTLPDRPRRWALARIAAAIAGSRPDTAESLLREAAADPQVIESVVARMAAANPNRAAQFARSLPSGDLRDGALGAVAAALAVSDYRKAGDLVWEMSGPSARDRAVPAVALQAAAADTDAATSLIGLVSEPSAALRLRAKIAARVAPRDPRAALRLLETLPDSDYRRAAALDAAAAALAAGRSADEALKIATIGVPRDVALRWLLPDLAVSQTGSPIGLSDSIGDAYLRALALTDVARRLERMESRPRPSPSLAQMIRPVAEWDGI
ncbi:MAG: hypothetical protein ABSD48_06225 [Armatimonadota bacterium]